MTEKTDLEEQVLGAETIVNPTTRKSFVHETYGHISSLYTAEQARERAQGIFSAAGVAEACASLMSLTVFESGKKGFGKPSLVECERKAAEAVKIVNLVYEGLSKFPPGVTVGYGLKIDKREVIPTVILFWGEDQLKTGEPPDEDHHIRMMLESAKQYATQLLACAEAIETDNFLHFFYQQELGLEYKEVQQILARLALFRQQNRSEDLLEMSNSKS